MPAIAAADQAVVAWWLYGEFGQRQNDSCEDIYADLLVHRARRSSTVSEHPVPTEQAGNETVHAILFAAVHVLQQ